MRVISGNFKGRRLKSLSGDNTRPTTDKVKESIFNMIGPYFDGGCVLDLYSGSGSLAIEAVSRGCEKAICVDNNFQAMKIIKENITLTKELNKFIVKKMDADKVIDEIARSQEKVHLVFLDPPYAKQKIEEQIENMQKAGILADDCKIVCEIDNSVVLKDVIVNYRMVKCQKYGNTKIMIYEKGE